MLKILLFLVLRLLLLGGWERNLLRYRRSTMLTARQVLRGLAAHCRVPPSQHTRGQIDAYLHANRRYAASWIAMNIRGKRGRA